MNLRGGERGEALAREHELIADGAADAGVEGLDALLDAVLGGGDEFGGGGGGGGAEVGDEVRDGEVGLVADGRDDGQPEAAMVRARASSLKPARSSMEPPPRAMRMRSTLFGVGVEAADAGDDGGGAVRALHGGGIDQQIEARVAAANDLDDVVQDGAAGGGDDADGAGEGGQGTLAGGVEEAFGEQAGFELLEGELQRARAAGLDRLGDELELAARLVDGDAAAHQDGEAILRAEAEHLGLAAKEHDGELGFAVFEREVDVAGGRGAAVGDLALDPEVGVVALDLLADAGDEVADGPDAAVGWWSARGWRVYGDGVRAGALAAWGREEAVAGAAWRAVAGSRPAEPAEGGPCGCRRLRISSPYRASLEHRAGHDDLRGLAIEVVGLDVGGDGGGKQAGAGVAGEEAAAELGGGDVFVDSGEQVDAGALAGREGELGELSFGEGEFGAADDDPLGEGEQLVGLAPAGKGEEAVGAGEDEEGRGGVFAGERGQGVDGVVWLAVGAGASRVETRKSRVAGAGCECRVAEGEGGHLQAVGEGGGRPLGFEGLAADRGEEDAVEGEGVGCGGGQAQMAAMDGVECAAEEGYAHC